MAAAPLGPLTLALWARPGWDEDGAAFLRVVAGTVAAGHRVALLCVNCLPETLAQEASAEGARTLEALTALGTPAMAADAAAVVSALEASCRLLLLGPKDRAHHPPLRIVTDTWLAQMRNQPQEGLRQLLAAGQAIRTRI